MSMNEIAIEERVWRRHSSVVRGEAACPALNEIEQTAPRETGPGIRLLTRFKAFWARMRPIPRRFEAVLSELAADWESAKTPEDVENSLLERLGSYAGTSRFELMRGGEKVVSDADERWSRRPGEVVLEIPLRSGGTARDRLRIYHRARGWRRLSKRKIARIRLFCDLAAQARESLRPRADCAWEESSAVWRDDLVLKADWSREQTAAAPQSPLVRDATFLSAILPFAIAQAKRHREPLSILCVAIDRLAGVKDLLGRQASDRAVTQVGEASASMIRTSDIVCRLDDDRILVVLPRACRDNAVHVAQSIRHAVAALPKPAGDEPGLSLTVSIGVAAYPTCATNVYSLFDAVDQALERAQNQGRDQVAV